MCAALRPGRGGVAHLGDVGFDALGQLHAGLPQQLGQLLGDVGVLVKGVEQTQTLELLGDALAPHLQQQTHKHKHKEELIQGQRKTGFQPKRRSGRGELPVTFPLSAQCRLCERQCV